MRPSRVWASTRKASLIGAERNHLWPVMRQKPSRLSSAWLAMEETSLPPCFSVMPMPMVMPAFSPTGRAEESYCRERMIGSQFSAIDGVWASAATEALVIVIGQTWPHSACAVM